MVGICSDEYLQCVILLLAFKSISIVCLLHKTIRVLCWSLKYWNWVAVTAVYYDAANLTDDKAFTAYY